MQERPNPGVIVTAIDPGDEKSAVVRLRVEVPRPFVVSSTKIPNAEVLEWIEAHRFDGPLAIEMIASYGMAVGRSVFETCVWVGRFGEAWGWDYVTRIYRRDVKLHLCGRTDAKDPNVRRAILDLYGPNEKHARGTKKAPGPLYGVSGDGWAALGVGLTFCSGEYTPAGSEYDTEESAA